jgi:ABC-type phosphate transport system substrate-binding protein
MNVEQLKRARRTFVGALSAPKRRDRAMPRSPSESGALRRLFACSGCVAAFVLTSGAAFAAGTFDAALPVYQPEREVSGEISSVGDDAMEPLMAAWLVAFQKKQPAIRKGARWEHMSGATAFGALMFEIADIAPLAREPSATELAPYAHQFAGDMMKSPFLVWVASAANQPVYLAVNKRPGAPLPPKVVEFVSFVLSRDGQEIVAKQGRFDALTLRQAAEERLKLQGFLAPLDPTLPPYVAVARVNGVISSVGSDGMKTLMDHWMREFRRVQPGVRKGERWEHLGTLNGFYALMVDETDLAPMGREIWPDERAAYAATHHQNAPLEIRVARGGFNTPQRTTAQAIFVNASNPLAQITLPQLAAILGRPQSITRWGQLGLTGQWTDRPVTIYTPPLVAPNAMSMQIMVLKGGAWSGEVHEGSIADTALAIARDPGAIGFGGFEEGGPGLKTLSVAARDSGSFYEGNAENASSGRYPLTRYMYIRLNRKPGESLQPQVKEFLRYILSRQGQEPILYSAYFPLTASEVKEELVKLE